MISSEVILDSVSPEGIRLVTYRHRYPKFIHGEFMTHRKKSRNASSSRAVPVAKNLEETRDSTLRARPVSWPAEARGMQGGAELTGETRQRAQQLWDWAAEAAANYAETMVQLGVHKSVANRVLEPFLHINVVATEVDDLNFFGLRLDRDAQPEMRALAEAAWSARSESTPTALTTGEWHLPFVTDVDLASINFGVGLIGLGSDLTDDLEVARRVSVARCARVSYESHETGRRSTAAEDLALFERLRTSGHWSAFEHQATPDAWTGAQHLGPGGRWYSGWAAPHEHGNLTGWRQFRKTFADEAVRPLPEGYAS